MLREGGKNLKEDGKRSVKDEAVDSHAEANANNIRQMAASVFHLKFGFCLLRCTLAQSGRRVCRKQSPHVVFFKLSRMVFNMRYADKNGF